MRNFEIRAINQQQKVMPVDKIKNINNNISTNNTQSMTNEEARQLTGKVAMTRALFETKENNSITSINSQQANKFTPQMNRTKQNLSNYNISDYNSKFQSQQQQQPPPKQSFSATNLSSILKQPSSNDYYKENKYMPKFQSNSNKPVEHNFIDEQVSTSKFIYLFINRNDESFKYLNLISLKQFTY